MEKDVCFIANILEYIVAFRVENNEVVGNTDLKGMEDASRHLCK